VGAAEERFRAKVRTRRGHDIWTGARDERGTGLVRINNKLKTAQRAAWEFAHGPLPADARVLACPAERACVRLEHLRLADVPTPSGPERAPRAPRGAGTKREIRPGVWELAIGIGTGPDGRARRRYLRVHGDERDAEAALEDLSETAHGPTRLGDLRVRELLDRYLTWLDDGADPTVRRLRQLTRDVAEPAIGHDFAALLDSPEIAELLEARHRAGASTRELRELLELIGDAYRWARRRRWTNRNPTADIALGDFTQ
jgi:hypothetical protein